MGAPRTHTPKLLTSHPSTLPSWPKPPPFPDYRSLDYYVGTCFNQSWFSSPNHRPPSLKCHYNTGGKTMFSCYKKKKKTKQTSDQTCKRMKCMLMWAEELPLIGSHTEYICTLTEPQHREPSYSLICPCQIFSRCHVHSHQYTYKWSTLYLEGSQKCFNIACNCDWHLCNYNSVVSVNWHNTLSWRMFVAMRWIIKASMGSNFEVIGLL